MRTESRLTIGDEVDRVWAYLCEVRRWTDWAPTVVEAWTRDGAALHVGSWIEQRGKAPLGLTHRRSQQVTVLDQPSSMAFAGPMGTSSARWGMRLAPAGAGRTDTMMWVEVDLAGAMRAIPARWLEARIQRVSDLEMTAIRAAVEAGPHRDEGARRC